MATKNTSQKAADHTLESIKSLIRDMEHLGDMVMTIANEAQEQQTQNGAVGAIMAAERQIAALQQIYTTIITLHQVRK